MPKPTRLQILYEHSASVQVHMFVCEGNKDAGDRCRPYLQPKIFRWWHPYFRKKKTRKTVLSRSSIPFTEVCWIPQNGAKLNCPNHVDVDLMSGFQLVCQSRRLKTLNPRPEGLRISGHNYIKSWWRRGLRWLIGMSIGVCSAALSPSKFINQHERGRANSGADRLPWSM